MLLRNSAGYERRVMNEISEFPHRLLLLVREQAQTKCFVRMDIASELLGRRDEELEINALKIKKRFKADLEAAAANGTLSWRLFWLLRGTSFHLKSDNRDSERINKMISLQEDRCPSSTLDLRSSRTSLKYQLGAAGEGSSTTGEKWSDVRPVAQRVREHCLRDWESVVDVQSDPNRWSPTVAAPDCQPGPRLLYLQGKLKPHLCVHSASHVWAASWNMIVRKKIAKNLEKIPAASQNLPVAVCVAIRRKDQRGSHFTFYISAEIVRRKYIMLQTCWSQQSRVIEWKTLQGFKPLLTIIKDQYSNVRAGHTVCLMQASLTSLGCTSTGALNCATVGETHTLVQLSLDSKQKGLELLLREHGDHRNVDAADDKGGEEDGDSDSDDNIEGEADNNTLDKYQYKVAKSVLAISGRDDDDVDQRAEEALISGADVDVAEQHERGVALEAMEKKQCNIDTPENQAIMRKLQLQQGLDPSEPAWETAYAAAIGITAADVEASEVAKYQELTKDTDTELGFANDAASALARHAQFIFKLPVVICCFRFRFIVSFSFWTDWTDLISKYHHQTSKLMW